MLLAVHVRAEATDELRDVSDDAVQVLVERQAAQPGQRRALVGREVAANPLRAVLLEASVGARGVRGVLLITERRFEGLGVRGPGFCPTV